MKKLKNIYMILFVCFIIFNALAYNMMKKYAITKTEDKIKTYLYNMKSLRGYISNIQKSEIYRLQNKKSLKEDYFSPILLSSTFIATAVGDSFNVIAKENNVPSVRLRFASDNPRNMGNLANEKENEILNKFRNNDIKEYKEVLDTKNGKELYYAIPSKHSNSKCTKCHGDPKDAPIGMIKLYGDKNGFYEKEGSIRAIISATYPLKNELKEINFVFFIILITSFIFSILIGLLIYQFSKSLTLKNEYLSEAMEKELENNKEKEAILFQQSKLTQAGDMFVNITQQWRQPLSIISTIATGLKLEKEFGDLTDEKLNKSINDMTTNVEYLSKTIDNFSNFVKKDSKKYNFDIKKAIEKSLSILDVSIIKNNILLIKDLSNSSYLSYENEFIQVNINLLNYMQDNLIKYLEVTEEKLIFISNKIEDNKTIIEIKNNSGGIPQDEIKHIFDKDFLANKNQNNVINDLYIAKEIIAKHFNGSIEAINEDFEYKDIKYKGAKFIIILEDLTTDYS